MTNIMLVCLKYYESSPRIKFIEFCIRKCECCLQVEETVIIGRINTNETFMNWSEFKTATYTAWRKEDI